MTEDENSVIDVNDLDENFKFEVAKQPGGENILYCFQCGTCAAVCPVGSKNEVYDPRRIIRMTILGMREEVLSSDAIWLCSTCYSCYVRCPQDVKITNIINAIQNIAAKEGHAHSSYKIALGELEKRGITTEISEFENSQREKLECPHIEENPDEAKKILKRTKIFEILGED
jgi:heterodisulfide reductase subunit C